MMGIVALEEKRRREQMERLCEDIARNGHLQARKIALARNQISLYLDLRHSASRTVRE